MPSHRPSRKPIRTNKQVAILKGEEKRYQVKDADLRGHYIRVTPKGVKTFWAVARAPNGGKPEWKRVGEHPTTTIEEARGMATEFRKLIKDGKPSPSRPDSFGEVAQNYIELELIPKGTRTLSEIERVLTKYVYPHWQHREFVSIGRGDISKLLDRVTKENGPRQADCVLTILRAMTNWYVARVDDYRSPIVTKMRRYKYVPRKRSLNDKELRIVWKVAEVGGAYGAILRVLLLTGQRREKVAAMQWDDIEDGVWNIPYEEGEKGNGANLPLSEQALTIINSQKRKPDNPYVFAGRGDNYFQGFSPCKRAFDAKVLDALREAAVKNGDNPEEVEPLPPWRNHDLRRTASTIMSDADVRPDIVERVLGHQIQGVAGTYNQAKYQEQKSRALKTLATRIEMIVNPATDNAVAMRGL